MPTAASHRITFDPDQCGGRPCIRGYRLRVTDVLDMLASGASTEEILADYEFLQIEDIHACLRYASSQIDHPGHLWHRRKRALILEAERHRYDALLSDISGRDIESHANDPDQAIRCVRNWLSEDRPRNAAPLPGAAAMQDDHRLFQVEVGALLTARRLDPDDLTHSDFLWAVNDWIAARAAPPP